MTSDPSDDALFEVVDEAVPRPPPEIIPAGRIKLFRPYSRARGLLLPPSLDDWLPQSHSA